MIITKQRIQYAILIFISNAILLFPLFVHAQTPINYGQTLAGSISAPGEIDSYTFSGSLNDRVTIRAWRTSGTFTRYLQLYGPSGNLITSGYQVDRTLTEEGTYRIDIKDQYNTNTGDYLLYLEKLNNPGNVVADLECGQMTPGSIGMSVDTPPSKIYTLTAAANEKVTIRVLYTSGAGFLPHMEFYDPAGTLIVSTYSQIDRTLTQAGSYKLLIRDYYNTYSGTFVLNWQRVNNPCNATPISCGQVLSGSVSAAGEIDFYTFTASAGDVITIRYRKITGALVSYLELYNPNGALVTTGGQITTTLAAAGTYRIDIRDQNGTNTGDYILYLGKLNSACNATPLSCGQVETGTIGATADPPPWRMYTFTVASNEAVTIRTVKTSGIWTPVMELYNPAGALLTTTNEPIHTTLSMAGTYSLLIRDYSNAYTGNFLITWQSISNPCNATPINCGQAITGSIDSVAEMDIHTFTVSANDGVTIRVRKTSGTFTPNIELYGPNGNYLTGSTTGKIDQVLTTAGTCRLVVRDNAYANTGTYLLYWQKTNNPCNATPINCGQVVTGSIGTSTDPPPWKAYPFTASAGDVVSIRSMKTSAGTFISFMELYGPNGNYITYRYNSPLEWVLPTTGTYTILIMDYYSAYAGDFFLTYQVMSNPCNALPITCDQVLTGSISGLADIDVYTFTASANDNVTIWVGKISGSFSPYLEIITPSNARLWESGTTWTGTLTAAGMYKIIVRDTYYANTGDYVIYWQRWNNPCATPLACGQVQTGYIGTMADPPAWRYYTFNASANDSVTIRATRTSGALTPYIALYGPTGTVVGGGANQLDKILVSAGPYTIKIYDQTSSNTGEYLITLQKVNNPCNATPIGCGWVVSGSLSAVGKINAYTFTANSGDNVVLTLTKTSGGLDPSLEIYNSSGTRIAYQYVASGNQATVTQTLTAAGVYTVFVFDYGNNETGSYTLKLQKNNNICPEVTLSAPNGGDRLVASSNYTISWACTSTQGINSQEIRLSSDGGQTYPYLIATGLQGNAQSYNWTVPQGIITTQGRIRVIVTDTSGMSTFDESDSNFEIYQAVGRTYIYDERNQLIQILYEDGRAATYTYDGVGNRLENRAHIPDTTPPTTTASPAGGAYGSVQSVTLTCNDGSGSGCDKIYYTTDGTIPTTSSSIYSTPILVSETTLKYFATDLAGNSETIKTQIYTIDTVPPTGTITISSGAAYTTSTNVNLTLSCSDSYGCSQMQFSNDSITYSTPEAYSTTKAWALSPGDGTKTVYVKFKDTPGNWSTAYSDTIMLDATPPSTTALPAGGTYNSAQSVTLTCSDGSGSGYDKIYYTTDGTTPTTSSTVYSSPINISATSALKFFATDLAGNSETVKTETYTISTDIVTVELKDSTGALLSGGVVQYYSGGWQTFGTTDASGRVSKELMPGTYTFSMNYAFGRQEKSQNTATNPTVLFQTTRVTVQLTDSTGTLMDTGTVQYYSGGWRDIGSTSGGQVTKELLPGSYTFSMTYGFARQEKAQNVATNPTVVFQTTRVTVQLTDSTGALMDTGTVQYYSGGWRDIGSTSGGQVTKELLPGSYTFSMTYGFARQEKSQNIATNSTVVFQTTRVTVELRDSANSLMDTGAVQYYSGGWRDIGSTSGGQVTKELLPGSYTFSMNYSFARQEKAQNVATNSTVVFQTTRVTVELRDSANSLIDAGTVQYYSGGWRDIGSTSGGQVTKELLPGSYTFSMNYSFARQEKAQNVATNSTVVFQTTRVTVELRDSANSLMDTGTVQYYSGGWRDIGSTSGGQVTKELLPGSYTFSMTYGFARQEKSQNITTNSTVVFQTGKVHSDSSSCTYYYGGGWRVFIQDMELLPVTYTFRSNDGTPDSSYIIITGTVNHIH